MNERERELAIERALSAARERERDGRIMPHPAWADLDAEGRRELYRQSLLQREIEAASDDAGLSATAHAVLERIRQSGRA